MRDHLQNSHAGIECSELCILISNTMTITIATTTVFARGKIPYILLSYCCAHLMPGAGWLGAYPLFLRRHLRAAGYLGMKNCLCVTKGTNLSKNTKILPHKRAEGDRESSTVGPDWSFMRFEDLDGFTGLSALWSLSGRPCGFFSCFLLRCFFSLLLALSGYGVQLRRAGSAPSQHRLFAGRHGQINVPSQNLLPHHL